MQHNTTTGPPLSCSNLYWNRKEQPSSDKVKLKNYSCGAVSEWERERERGRIRHVSCTCIHSISTIAYGLLWFQTIQCRFDSTLIQAILRNLITSLYITPGLKPSTLNKQTKMCYLYSRMSAWGSKYNDCAPPSRLICPITPYSQTGRLTCDSRSSILLCSNKQRQVHLRLVPNWPGPYLARIHSSQSSPVNFNNY